MHHYIKIMTVLDLLLDLITKHFNTNVHLLLYLKNVFLKTVFQYNSTYIIWTSVYDDRKRGVILMCAVGVSD